MPPTDDSADDHLPVVNGATPSNDDAGRLALPTWFTTQGDLGPDFVLHRDGQTEVSHCKWSGHGRSRLEHYVFFTRHSPSICGRGPTRSGWPAECAGLHRFQLPRPVMVPRNHF